MRLEFRGMNYHTVYSATGFKNVNKCRHACFSDISLYARGRRKESGTAQYKLYICVTDAENRTGNDDACLVDIDKYLTLLKDVVNFDFKIEKEDEDHVVVTVDFTGPLVLHFFLLTCIRYTYEYPHNVILLDAMMLHDTGECADLNIIDLYNIVNRSMFNGTDGLHGVLGYTSQCLVRPLTKKELHNRSRCTESLNDFYHSIDIKVDNFNYGQIRKYYSENQINTFGKRVKAYIENYNKVIKWQRKYL